MKALAIIIQTKRGENAFVVTSNNFTQELAQEYSHAIYNIIIRSFKKSQRVDRTFLFKRDLSAVCNISKDVIIQIIIPNNEVQYGVECLKKANELLTRHARNETTLKKYTEIFSNLEELIYSRDYSPLKLQLTFKPSEIQSAKKSIDNDLYAKFPLLTHEGEKSLIQNVPLKYSKRAFTHHREAHIRYQVAKTCQFPISASVTQDTELKRFYKHNLSNNAFNKGQARPSLHGKGYGRQSSTRPASYVNQVQLPDLEDDEPRPMYQMSGMPGMSGMPNMPNMPNMSGIKGLADLNMPPASPSIENSRPKVVNVMDLYSSMSNIGNKGEDLDVSGVRGQSYIGSNDYSYNQGSPPGSNSKPRKKIFETHEEKKEGSFNTFSHDLFNTVSLPAQVNLGERPGLDSSMTKSRPAPPIYENTRPNYMAPESSRENNWALNQSMQSMSKLDFDSRSNQQGFGQSQGESLQTLPNKPDVHSVYIRLLKIMEKFYLTLQNSKVQTVKVVGQVAIEIDDNEGLPPLSLLLTPPSIWDDESKIIKRPSRKELFTGSSGPLSILQLGRLKGNVPLYDYLVNQKSFDPSRIPMFFIYKIEDAGTNAYNILMQYKMNEKLNQTFYEVEITATFKTDISRFGVKTLPPAQKITERLVNWRTKSLSPDSKGKLCISLENCIEPAARILEEIKITLKGLTVIHEEMNVYASFQPNVSHHQYKDPSVFKVAQKRQIIEYKVLPNTQ